MPQLVKQYLEWKHSSVEVVNGPGELFEVTAVYTFGKRLDIPINYIVTYHTLIGRTRHHNVHQNTNELSNVALIKTGLLGCSPETPSVAISLDTLELFHRLWHCHGQLSVQAMARVLCDLHNVCILHFMTYIG